MSISTLFSFILPIDRVLSTVTTPGQCGSGSDGNEEVHCIPQSSSITNASPTDFMDHIQDARWRSAEVQLVYSTDPVDWDRNQVEHKETGKFYIAFRSKETRRKTNRLWKTDGGFMFLSLTVLAWLAADETRVSHVLSHVL